MCWKIKVVGCKFKVHVYFAAFTIRYQNRCKYAFKDKIAGVYLICIDKSSNALSKHLNIWVDDCKPFFIKSTNW